MAEDAPKTCFPPVVNAATRVLILGSLPGEASLQAAQYYAHPRNQFWLLLGAILDEDLVALDYPSRLQCLLAHHVGLWDVIAEARRQGSLDAAIREQRHNDLQALVMALPQLRAIGFNGATAYRAADSIQQDGLIKLALPSSSPAYTLPFAQKLARWQSLRPYLV